MNYTGFGADPSRIYSFNPYSYGSAIERMVAPHRAMAGLRSSIGYRQAGREGRQRMETLAGMGLPTTTDISRVRGEGLGYGGRPIFSAPRPQAFGTYGSIGMNKKEDEDVEPPAQPIPPTPPLPAPPQPAALPFTGFGGMVERQNTPSLAGSLIGFGGIPRFPFAGY